jgi:hypothetical protein
MLRLATKEIIQKLVGIAMIAIFATADSFVEHLDRLFRIPGMLPDIHVVCAKLEYHLLHDCVQICISTLFTPSIGVTHTIPDMRLMSLREILPAPN